MKSFTKYVLVLFMLFNSISCFSQLSEQKLDSLIAVADTMQNDSARAFLLARLSSSAIKLDPELTLKLANESISIVGENKWYKSLIVAYGALGNLYRSQDLYVKSIKNFQKSLSYVKEQLAIATDSVLISDDRRNVTISLYNIASIYQAHGNITEARKYVDEGLDSALNQKDTLLIGALYNLLGSQNSMENNHYQAIDNYRLSLKIGLEQNNISSISAAYNNIGNEYKNLNHADSALKYYKLSLHYGEKIKKVKGNVASMVNIGDLYIELNMPDSAYKYLSKAEPLADSIKALNYISKIQLQFSKYYEKIKDYKSSLSYYKDYKISRDSLQDASIVKQLASAETKFKIEEAQKEEQRERERKARVAKEKQDRANYLQLQLAALIIGVLLIITLILSRLKISNRAIEIIALFTLLAVFEYIMLLIDPILSENTALSGPLFLLLAHALIAFLFTPIHDAIAKLVLRKKEN